MSDYDPEDWESDEDSSPRGFANGFWISVGLIVAVVIIWMFL